MYTNVYESCRIHHNGDFDDNIYITNKESNSKSVNKKVEISISVKDLISKFRIYKKSMSGMVFKNKTIKIESSNLINEIEVLFADIQSFVEFSLEKRIIEKLYGKECSYEDLEKIADILKIKLI